MRDPAKLKSEAHSLKGASANLGLSKIRKTAMVPEKMGENKNLAEVPAAIKELKGHFQHFGAYIDNLDWNTIMSTGS